MGKPVVKGKTKGASGRSYRGGGGLSKTPNRSRHRSESSRRWIQRQLNDPFVAEARAKGYRSRSALKLEQIDEKYNIFGANMVVLDLGCAPGGWLQYASQKIAKDEEDGDGRLVGVDLLETASVAGAEILKGDIHDEAMVEQLISMLEGGADVVLSDMAADTTGHRGTDHLRTTALLERALLLALRVLRPRGVFLAKCFRGGAERHALAMMRRDFAVVRHIKPRASRAESVESYVLATGFRGAADEDERLLSADAK